MFSLRVAALVTALALLTGCGESSPTPRTTGSKAAVTVENCGRKLSFATPPKRAVTYYQSTLEMLLALGLRSSVAGREGFAESPLLPEQRADFAATPELAKGPYPPSREKVLSARPDFVFVADPSYEFDPSQGLASLKDLQSADVPVYVMTAHCTPGHKATIDDVYTDIANLGKIFHAESRATALITRMKAQIQQVQTKIRGLGPTRIVVFESSGPITVATGHFFDLPALAGADNVFGDQPGTDAQVNAEKIVDADPQAFVTDNYQPGPDAAAKRAYLLKTFPTTEAARSGRVIPLQNIDISPGVRNAQAVETLARGLYPQAF